MSGEGEGVGETCKPCVYTCTGAGGSVGGGGGVRIHRN